MNTLRAILWDGLLVLSIISLTQLLLGHMRPDEPRRSPRRR